MPVAHDDSSRDQEQKAISNKAFQLDDLATFSVDVHRQVAWRIKHAEDAADVAQQALLKAALKLSSFRGRNLRAWVFAITNNLIIDYYRARGRRVYVDVDVAETTERVLRTEEQCVPENCDRSRQLQLWLLSLARLLALEEQVAVLMADIYGYRAKDSAPKLQITVPSYKLLLHDARAYLRKCLSEHNAVHYGQHKAPITCPLATNELRGLRADLLRGIIDTNL